MPLSVSDFYDGLAEQCHLVYGDRWETAVEEYDEVLERLIRSRRPTAVDILDCVCA